MADVHVVEPKTGKRKRGSPDATSTSQATLHIIVGSYERTLHGFTASIHAAQASQDGSEVSETSIDFQNSFLLNAHTSAIRCLALSPPTSHRRTLATGGTDERINLYQLSNIAPSPPTSTSKSAKKPKQQPLLPTPDATPTSPTPIHIPSANRTLGTLAHHTSTITSLSFPTPTKLLTASLDNTIAVVRARDWYPLTTLKAPIPTPHGRPSGDTIGPGEVPAGVSDVAVHPSLRLGISVGVGERCMRLWNLVGGKKAGVLVFERSWLAAAGEGGGGTGSRLGLRGGEAKSVVWREDGEQFAVGFEKGALIYGLDCEVRGAVKVATRDKITRLRYLPTSPSPKNHGSPQSETADGAHPPTGPEKKTSSILVISTESGDVLFFNTADPSIPTASNAEASKSTYPLVAKSSSPLSTVTSSQRSRIKDFVILPAHTPSSSQEITDETREQTKISHYIITATSLGSVRIYTLDATSLPSFSTPSSDPLTTPATDGTTTKSEQMKNTAPTKKTDGDRREQAPEVGTHIGSYETGKRITCLAAFVMVPATTVSISTSLGDTIIDGDSASDDEDRSGEDDGEEESRSNESDDGNNVDDDMDGEVRPYTIGGVQGEVDEEGQDDDFGGFDD